MTYNPAATCTRQDSFLTKGEAYRLLHKQGYQKVLHLCTAGPGRDYDENEIAQIAQRFGMEVTPMYFSLDEDEGCHCKNMLEYVECLTNYSEDPNIVDRTLAYRNDEMVSPARKDMWDNVHAYCLGFEISSSGEAFVRNRIWANKSKNFTGRRWIDLPNIPLHNVREYALVIEYVPMSAHRDSDWFKLLALIERLRKITNVTLLYSHNTRGSFESHEVGERMDTYLGKEAIVSESGKVKHHVMIWTRFFEREIAKIGGVLIHSTEFDWFNGSVRPNKPHRSKRGAPNYRYAFAFGKV